MPPRRWSVSPHAMQSKSFRRRGLINAWFMPESIAAADAGIHSTPWQHALRFKSDVDESRYVIAREDRLHSILCVSHFAVGVASWLTVALGVTVAVSASRHGTPSEVSGLLCPALPVLLVWAAVFAELRRKRSSERGVAALLALGGVVHFFYAAVPAAVRFAAEGCGTENATAAAGDCATSGEAREACLLRFREGAHLNLIVLLVLQAFCFPLRLRCSLVCGAVGVPALLFCATIAYAGAGELARTRTPPSARSRPVGVLPAGTLTLRCTFVAPSNRSSLSSCPRRHSRS